MSNSMSRRRALGHLAGAAALTATAGLAHPRPAVASEQRRSPLQHSPFQHSVCKWCYSDLSVNELAAAAKGMGIQSVELLQPQDWPALEEHGLTCAMVSDPLNAEFGIAKGFNRLAHHEQLVPAYKERIRETAEAGYPNVICFSGNREGLSDEEGLKNCAEGLRQIMPAAEEADVTVCMELLNSKVNHPDYQCDHTAWGVRLVERVGSERFRLLYDIYHMQIMEGDVIRTIRDHQDAIAHYHTAGVPGRHEIDETQELNYPAIMRAIAETGFTDFVAQEFIPTGEPLPAFREAVAVCSV